jgi:hypothetical protein
MYTFKVYIKPPPATLIVSLPLNLMDSRVSFLAFCNLCEHLNRLGKIEQKKQKLTGFIEEWRKEDSKSLYSFIRLLLPHVQD